MTCSVCGAFSGIHKRCVYHATNRPLGEVFDLVTHEWSGERDEPYICRHNFLDWTDCPVCTSAADFDYGAFS